MRIAISGKLLDGRVKWVHSGWNNQTKGPLVLPDKQSNQKKTVMRKILIAATALSLITTAAWAASDDSGTVNGQAKSNMPAMGAGSTQGAGANSEEGGTGVKASAQGEGATNKDTQPRDTAPVVPQ